MLSLHAVFHFVRLCRCCLQALYKTFHEGRSFEAHEVSTFMNGKLVNLQFG